MSEFSLTSPIFIAAALLFMDMISAGIFMVILRQREHPLAYVIPSVILLSGVVAAVAILYFTLGSQSN